MYTHVKLNFTPWATSQENLLFAYRKTKAQISCMVTAHMISAFVFVCYIGSAIPLLPKP